MLETHTAAVLELVDTAHTGPVLLFSAQHCTASPQAFHVQLLFGFVRVSVRVLKGQEGGGRCVGAA